jgi:hypothetical protein
MLFRHHHHHQDLCGINLNFMLLVPLVLFALCMLFCRLKYIRPETFILILIVSSKAEANWPKT